MMDEPAPPRSYELTDEPPKPRRSYLMIAGLSLGFLLFAGLGACAWQLNRVIVGRSDATEAFVKQVHAEGYPAADSAIWYSMTPEDQSRIDESSLYLRSRGLVHSVKRPICRLRKQPDGFGVRPNELICSAIVHFDDTGGAHLFVWKWADDRWKIADSRFMSEEEGVAKPPA